MKTTTCAAFLGRLALVLGFAGFAQAQIVLDPNLPSTGRSPLPNVQSVLANGSGCPMGKDVSTLVQGDILWVKFPDAQTAQTGPNTSLSASRRNCAITLRFGSSDRTFTIDSVAFFIDADLPAQSTAFAQVSWFFEGQGQTGSFADSLQGDYSGTWLNNFDTPVSNEVWKPCGLDRALTVNSSIRISGPRDQAAQAQWQVVGFHLKSKSCY